MKILVLGIDALDRLLLDAFATHLPNITDFRKCALDLRVRSTFPPDSDTAWATISTGLNPAEHGIVHFVDPLEKSYQIQNKQVDNTILHGKTFWEMAGQMGYKTYAIFPHLGYPVWDVPGVMVARGSSVAEVQATDPKILERYPDPENITGVRGFPERTSAGMQAYHHRLSKQARADAEFALRMLKDNDWDIFFVYWSTIDAVGHFFWNYYDTQDPSYVKGNPLQKVIPETYQLYDDIVGQFLAAVPADTAVIILSDHGHGARPFKLVSVNEVLRKGGYISAKDPMANPHLNAVEKSKRLAIKTVSRFGLGKLAGRVMRNFPGIIQGFTRPAWINWDKTVAYTTDMSGIKAYSYGGVRINRSALGDQDYETLRSEIIAYLQRELKLPDGSSLLRFIARREDIYNGPFIDQYPEIVFEFIYSYGVGWALYTPLITEAASYNLVPGSHRGETGVCIYRGPDSDRFQDGVINLDQVSPLISDLLKIQVEEAK